MALKELQRSFVGGEMSPHIFGRPDDVRFQHGATKLQNLICVPQGPVRKRPGLQFVREIKDSTNQARLLPFRFSQDDTSIIEMGRATVSAREIGYLRFHTDGGTVLHAPVRSYVGPSTVTSQNRTSSTVTFTFGTDKVNWTTHLKVEGETVVFSTTDTLPAELTVAVVYWIRNPGANDFEVSLTPAGAIIDLTDNGTGTHTAEAGDILTTSGDHGLVTGDPIVLTMHPTTTAVTFSTTTGVVLATHGFKAGQQVIFEAQGSAALPAELEDRRLYYVVAEGLLAGSFNVSQSRGGNLVTLTTGGTTPTVNIAALPKGDPIELDARRTYYTIRISDTTLKIAATNEDALAATQISLATSEGTADDNDIKVHYDDRVGGLVEDSTGVLYCFRRPMTGESEVILTLGDHNGHDPTNVNFWVGLPGKQEDVTFDLANDEVDWTGHAQVVGETVIFSSTGALPTEITAGVTYYLRAVISANAFTLSTTKGGSLLTLSGSLSGTHTAVAGSIYEAPHFFDFTEILEVGYAQSKDVMTVTHRNRPAIELRRFGATSWVVEEIKFNSALRPMDVTVTPTFGFGFEVSGFTSAAVCTISSTHTLVINDTVMALSLGDLADGIYSIIDKSGTTLVTLGELDTQNGFTGLATTVTAGSSKIQPVVAASSEPEVYVVTSINDRNEESAVSEEFSVLNNLLAAGSYNDISWTAVAGAKRYVIYKKVIGLFALIGTVESPTVTFRDENIKPDASKTSPILDDSLRRTQIVTFDTSNDYVLWDDHGHAAGTPVIFQSSSNLPANIVDYQTYFVLNPETNSFQISAVLGDGTAVVLAAPSPADERHEATAGLFPTAVAYFEQRRIFAGSATQTQRVSMTASGTESDLHFSIPSVDSNRIKLDVSSREAGGLRHVAPLSHLLLLSSATEYRVTSINDDALTPASVTVRPQSFVGASLVHPAFVNNTAIFAADRGGHLRELGYSRDVLGYLTGDLSLRATHLVDGLTIVDIALSKAPQPVIWCVSSGGNMLGLTYIPEESIGAWHRHTTDGTFESVAAVAEGLEDRTYVIVKRTINSLTVRYVERMEEQEFGGVLADAFFVDAGATYSGTATTSITGLDHLKNEAVAVLAAGLVVKNLTVSATGTLTLTTAATPVHIGLAYTAEIETLPISLQMQAWGRGTPKNVNSATVRAIESGDFLVGPNASELKSAKVAAGALLDATADITIPGSWGPDGTLILRQTDPLPLTVTEITYEVAHGG